MQEDKKQYFGVVEMENEEKFAVRIEPVDRESEETIKDYNIIEGETDATITMQRIDKDGRIERTTGFGEVSEAEKGKYNVADVSNTVKWKDDTPGTNTLVNHKSSE